MYIYFYKVVFFFSACDKNTLTDHNKQKKIYFIKKTKTKNYIQKNKPRFSYFIDLYFVEFLDYVLLINVYFFTTLKFYKRKLKSKKTFTKFFKTFNSKDLIDHELGSTKFNPTNKQQTLLQNHFIFKTFF